jgi:hypothetical protein
MEHGMNRWTLLDWVVTLAPFLILTAAGYAAYHRSKTT